MRDRILYQAYGSVDHINECKYALLKMLQVYNLRPSVNIIIYTDQPQAFESFQPFFPSFILRHVSASEIKKWRGSEDFVHRVKIGIIKDFFESHDDNLLYCDTDTYLSAPVEDIFSGVHAGDFYMHEYEGEMNQPEFYKWENFLSKNEIRYNHKFLKFSRHLKIWNAGVIGLNYGSSHLVDDVLALTDAVYSRFPKHIAEQFAFSYCLQEAGAVKSASGTIQHYWNLKEFRALLALFFERNKEESIPNLVKLVRGIDAAAILRDKTKSLALPVFRRIINRLIRRNWTIKPYMEKI